jgi:hypothetical protein
MAVLQGFLQTFLLAMLAVAIATRLGFGMPMMHNANDVPPPALPHAGATHALL